MVEIHSVKEETPLRSVSVLEAELLVKNVALLAYVQKWAHEE